MDKSVGYCREVCRECGGRLRVHRFDRDHGVWVWCGDCGLLEDGERVGLMTTGEFFVWVKRMFANCGYGDLRELGGLVERMGNEDALKVWLVRRSQEKHGER